MPSTTRVNGDVQSTNQQGSTLTAVIRFPIDPPPVPPALPYEDKTFEITEVTMARLERVMFGDPPGKVDVTTDDADPTHPTGVKVHK